MKSLAASGVLLLGAFAYASTGDCPENFAYPSGSPLKKDASFFYAGGQAMRLGNSIYYPDGRIFKFNSSYFYPNGTYLKSGSSLFYPNGVHLKAGTSIYYPSGAYLKQGSDFYYPSRAVARRDAALFTEDGQAIDERIPLQAPIENYGHLHVWVGTEEVRYALRLRQLLAPEAGVEISFSGLKELVENSKTELTVSLRIPTGVSGESLQVVLRPDGSMSCLLRRPTLPGDANSN